METGIQFPLDFYFRFFKHIKKGQVFFRGHQIEIIDDLIDHLLQLGDNGLDVVFIKKIIPAEFFAHIGHEVQGLVVVIQQLPKGLKKELKGQLFFLFFTAPKICQRVNHGGLEKTRHSRAGGNPGSAQAYKNTGFPFSRE